MELAECKKEIATLKDRISEVETEKEKLQTSVRGYTETIAQQSGEISQLRGTLEGLKSKEIWFNRIQKSMIELQHKREKEEGSLSKTAKALRERDVQMKNWQTANSGISDTMEAGVVEMDVLNSLFRRHAITKNCEADLVDVDLINNQSYYSRMKKLSILALKDTQP